MGASLCEAAAGTDPPQEILQVTIKFFKCKARCAEASFCVRGFSSGSSGLASLGEGRPPQANTGKPEMAMRDGVQW
jgi:hypothetical protein